MDENMNRDEVMEQLEEQAGVEERSYDLPAEPELEGGFDLKSFAEGVGGTAAVIGIIAAVKYGVPKVKGFMKEHFPKKKKRDQDEDDFFDTDDAEDADFKDVDDSDEEEEAPEDKKKK